MKRTLSVMLALFVVIGAAARVNGENAGRTVAVCGTAERSAVPDILVWTVGVNTEAPDLQTAKKVNDERFEAALRVSREMAKDQQDVEAGPVRIDRIYSRNELGGSREFSHYSVRRTIKITQRRLGDFEHTLNALINSAEVELYFTYQFSDEALIRDGLRLQALDEAKKKAKEMVERLGGYLGQVVEISEFPPEDRGVQGIGLPAPPSPDPASPEARVISVKVYVTFEIK